MCPATCALHLAAGVSRAGGMSQENARAEIGTISTSQTSGRYRADIVPISCQFDGIIILSVNGAISPVYLHVIHALSLSKTDRIEKRLAVPTAFLWPRETPTNYRRGVRANRPPRYCKPSRFIRSFGF